MTYVDSFKKYAADNDADWVNDIEWLGIPKTFQDLHESYGSVPVKDLEAEWRNPRSELLGDLSGYERALKRERLGAYVNRRISREATLRRVMETFDKLPDFQLEAELKKTPVHGASYDSREIAKLVQAKRMREAEARKEAEERAKREAAQKAEQEEKVAESPAPMAIPVINRTSTPEPSNVPAPTAVPVIDQLVSGTAAKTDVENLLSLMREKYPQFVPGDPAKNRTKGTNAAGTKATGTTSSNKKDKKPADKKPADKNPAAGQTGGAADNQEEGEDPGTKEPGTWFDRNKDWIAGLGAGTAAGLTTWGATEMIPHLRRQRLLRGLISAAVGVGAGIGTGALVRKA